MTSVSGRKAQWILVDGTNYDFNPALVTQSDAKAYCIRNGGRLFEPRDSKTNRDVFNKAGEILGGLGAGLGGRELWIGVSDRDVEGEFQYASDQTPINFVCDGTAAGKSGCWQTNPALQFLALSPTVNVATQLDCVVGSSGTDGKWTVKGCSVTPAIPEIPEDIGTGDAANPQFPLVPAVLSTPSKFGSICEQAVAPSTTTQPPESTTSDSTCLKTGITVMIGMLFFCYQ